MAKRLNLSTAFIEMYTTLNDLDNSTPTDYAVMNAVLFGLNAHAWQKPYTTTVSYLAWTLNSKTTAVRVSLKRLCSSQLLTIKPAAEAKQEPQKRNVRQKIVISLGHKFSNYGLFEVIQQYNNNTSHSLVGGERS